MTRDGVSLGAIPPAADGLFNLEVRPRRTATSKHNLSSYECGESLGPGKSLESPGIKRQPVDPKMMTMEARLFEHTGTQRKSHRMVHHQIEKVRKPRLLRPVGSDQGHQNCGRRTEFPEDLGNESPRWKGVYQETVPTVEERIRPQGLQIVERIEIKRTAVNG